MTLLHLDRKIIQPFKRRSSRSENEEEPIQLAQMSIFQSNTYETNKD